MERINRKKKAASGISLAILLYFLLGVLSGCNDIGMRQSIDDLSTKDPEWVFMYKIEAPEGSDNVNFGSSVSISGEYIIVGDEKRDSNIGRAYIFKRNGNSWELDATLIPDGIVPTYFGYSVDIWGTQAASGAHYESAGGTLRGAVYVYEFLSGTWSQEFHYASPNNDDWLGYSVGVAEDIVVVGVPNLGGEGSVKMLTKDGGGWIYSDFELYASDHQVGAYFGRAVDIYGDYIIAGAPGYDEGSNTDAGKVYLFEFDGNNWFEETVPSFAESLVTDNHFGQCVSLFDTYAFAGAPDNNSFTAVYSREGDDWNKYSLPAGGEGFGSAVGVSDEFAVIGAPIENSNTGEIYFYERTGSTWDLYGDPVTADDGEVDDYFGCAVAVSNNYCVVGAEGVNNNGAVYVYEYTVYETP